MDRDRVEQDEAAIRRRCEEGDRDGAATAALRLYGPEIFGFLVSLHRRDSDGAGEAFSIFSEQLWHGVLGFGWHCSLRTWAYVVARNASHGYRRAEGRRARREAPGSVVSAVAEVVRTATPSYLGSDNQREIARLREEMPEEDQALLILRVDRQLAWLDLARIFLTGSAGPGSPDAAASPKDLDREAARLRKRFQIVKRRLLERGRQRGLLAPPEG
jgi:RNA polymerase sigma-70 factor (ECF subfamily)